MSKTVKYKCSCCGKVHEEWPALSFASPDNYNSLSEGDKKSIGYLDADFCTIKYDAQTDRFIREKVLATVGATLFTFFNKHPKLMVYAKGSTEPRTRLYQMGINQLIDEIDPEFYVFGELEREYERFNKNINYKSFIVIKKEK